MSNQVNDKDGIENVRYYSTLQKRLLLKKKSTFKTDPGEPLSSKGSIHMVTLKVLILVEYLRSTVTGN